MPRRSLARLYKDEFSGYSLTSFKMDVIAGVSVAAVALPLALAFGIASGAGAAAGLVTSIIGGLVIGALSGAPYQISGAKAATSAVLIVLFNHYGIEGVLIAGLLSGILLLIIGILRLGRFIDFIPAPVIRGFTSGIAFIITIRQLDNLFGFKTPVANTAALKLIGYFRSGLIPDWHAIVIGVVVIVIMAIFPEKWNTRIPSSLVGIIAATILTSAFGWSIPVIGAMPRTLILEHRINFSHIPWQNWTDFVAPALTLTVLGSVESLLCGAAGSTMTGIRLQVNQQLIGQGLGNIAIPFFGGVPTTSAIIRTRVGILAGGKTRLVSIIHAFALMAVMFFFAPFIEKIPLASLAGVLLTVAFRMHDWDTIRHMLNRRFKTNIIAFTTAMLATVLFDLTQAILFGSFLAGAVFLNRIASIEITLQEVDVERLRQKGIETAGKCKHVRVAFLTGPLFFAATGQFNEAFINLKNTHALILSMRGVPLIDAEGLEEIRRLYEKLQQQSGTLMFAGLHENVRAMMERDGLVQLIGENNFFWSSDQAIVEAERRGCKFCQDE